MLTRAGRPRVAPTRLRVLMALVPPTVRALRWGPLLAGAAGGLGLAGLGAWELRPGPGGLEPDPVSAVLWPRLATMALAVGVAFVLDDASEETTLAAPVGLVRRRLARLALAAGVVAAWWAGLALILGDVLDRAAVPLRPLALELGALATVSVALAAVAAPRLPGRLGGVAAGPATLALAAAAFLLPERIALYAWPGGPAWEPAHRRWLVVLAAAALVLLAASRDPGRWPLLSRRGRARPRPVGQTRAQPANRTRRRSNPRFPV